MTWLVLGVGVLLIAFPAAHALVLTSLYIPVPVMLFGLILRGVLFDCRVKAASEQKRRWNGAFAGGSLIAACAQGWMLGSYVTGLEPSAVNVAFSLLIALTLPVLYVVLGAGWLLLETEGELFDKALVWCRRAMPFMGIGLLGIPIGKPLVSETIAAAWFCLPSFIGLLPIPLAALVAFGAVYCVLNRRAVALAGYAWIVLGGAELAQVRACRHRRGAALNDRLHDLRVPRVPWQSDGAHVRRPALAARSVMLSP